MSTASEEQVARIGEAALKGLRDRKGFDLLDELAYDEEDPELWREIVIEAGEAALAAARAEGLL